MSSEPILRQSLQEIAQLLLMVYEKYKFLNVTANENVCSLCQFICDIGLENSVSILDIEYFRRKIVLSDDSGIISMGYEKFYVWLKEVASFHFRYDSISTNDKRAFHSLLVSNIIPFTSRDGGGVSVTSPSITCKWLERIDYRTLDTLVEFKELLKLWFMTILNQGSGCRMTPIDLCWKAIHDINPNIQITLTNIFASFKSSGICPTFVSSNQLLQLFRDISPSTDNQTPSLSFLQFLSLLATISQDVQEPQYHTTEYKGNPRLRYVLMYFSVSSMTKILDSFRSENNDMISCSPILWMLRQSGFTQLESVNTRSMLEQVDLEMTKVSSDVIPTSSSELQVQLDYIPIIICRLVCKVKHISYDVTNNAKESFSLCVLCLSYYLPGSLFISNQQSVLMKGLPSFYHIEFIRHLNTSYSIWEDAVTAYVKYRISLETSTSTIDDSNTIGWTINTIIAYTKTTRFIPEIVSEADFRHAARFTIWPYASHSTALENMNLSIMDMMETLFLVSCSQHHVNYMNPSAAFIQFKRVLDRFQHHRIDHQQSNSISNTTNLISMNLSPNLAPPQNQSITTPLHALQLDSSYSIDFYCEKMTLSPQKLYQTVLLVVFYPKQSYAFNSWQVAPIFNALIKQLHSSTDRQYVDMESSLSIAIQHICDEHHIDSNAFARYIVSKYDGSQHLLLHQPIDWHRIISTGALKPSIAHIINEEVMKLYFDEKILQLLLVNADLLKYEYCRIFSHYHVHDINMGDNFIHPFPIVIDESTTACQKNRHPNYCDISRCFLLPKYCIIAWAKVAAKLSDDIASKIYDMMDDLGSSEIKGRGLTFSSFIMYMVRCYSQQLIIQGSKSLTPAPITVDHVLDRVREMLLQSSQHLTKLQQSLRMRVLDPMFRNHLVSAPSNPIVDAADRKLITHTILFMFKQYHSKIISLSEATSSSEVRFVPPRPPDMFWDAPKLIEFCKFTGILASTGSNSYITAWRAYGSQLRSMNPPGISSWASNVVPPLPITADISSITAFLELFVQLCDDEDMIEGWLSPSDQSTIGLQVILSKVIMPFICAIVNMKPIEASSRRVVSFPLQSLTCTLADVFRYGGDQLFQQLNVMTPWLHMMFESMLLSCDQHPIEVDLTSVSTFLSCHGLLSAEIVASCIQASLHPRIRPNSMSKNFTYTLSIVEFQEAFIRCGLVVWELSGAAAKFTPSPSLLVSQHQRHDNHIHSQKPLFGVIATISSDLESIAQSYCNECNQLASERKPSVLDSDSKGSVTRSTWGIDFITPYYKVLCQYSTLARITSTQSTTANHLNRSGGININMLEAHLEMKANGVNYQHPINKANNLSQIDPLLQVSRVDPSPAKSISGHNMALRPEHYPSKSALSDKDAVLENLTNTLSGIKVANTQTISSSSSRKAQVTASRSSTDIPISPLPSSQTQKAFSSNVNKDLLEHTKEMLWPVYATYCSCGDSLEPGKLSGPNLFALLSKLGVLVDNTMLSDIGILLHRISSHTHATNINNGSSITSTNDSPSLTFEEFMIFLCAFSQLRFDKDIAIPSLPNSPVSAKFTDKHQEYLFLNWQIYISSSPSYRRLLEECIQPILRRHPLLASPEDARMRDKYSMIFSLEVLLAIEAVEQPLLISFQYDREEFLTSPASSPMSAEASSTEEAFDAILYPLEQMNLVPQIMTADQIRRLISDIIPTKDHKHQTPISPPREHDKHLTNSNSVYDRLFNTLRFPCWEWVIAVIAHRAVESAVNESYLPTDPQKIPGLIANLINNIAQAICKLHE